MNAVAVPKADRCAAGGPVIGPRQLRSQWTLDCRFAWSVWRPLWVRPWWSSRASSTSSGRGVCRRRSLRASSMPPAARRRLFAWPRWRDESARCPRGRTLSWLRSLRRPARAQCAASPVRRSFSPEHVADRVDLQVALGEQAFEAGVLGLGLAQAPDLGGRHLAVAALPAVEILLRDAIDTADLDRRQIALGRLGQDVDDLGFGLPRLFHCGLLSARRHEHRRWHQDRGASQPPPRRRGRRGRSLEDWYWRRSGLGRRAAKQSRRAKQKPITERKGASK